MLSTDDLAYHRARFQDELDRAYHAGDQAAANAHARLAALHMQRMKSEDERCGGSGTARR